MPLITKISKAPIGEFVIKFSTRHNRFEIEYPQADKEVLDKLTNKCITRNYELESWKDVEKELDSILNQYRQKFLLVRRVIIIQLQTSESTYGVTKPSLWDGKPETKALDKLYDGEGFVMRWYVADEYQYPTSKHLFYKITETNKNTRNRDYYLNNPRDHTNILPQLLRDDSGGALRVFDYTDELYQFIQEVQQSITNMLNRMNDYFSVDPQKFIDNIKQQIKLLPDGQQN